MSQVITNAFEQYWQSSLAAEQPVVLDEFILADIPNLDITSPIDPDAGLPPESQIVHRQNVDQRGRINTNAVAYSIVMDTTVGDFSFNAMYLRNKANGVIGMIVYKGRETKLKTDQTTGQTGNSLVKSMLMGYDQAAEATLTNVDAGTWQIDYAARLRGQDEDLRQLASQLYGHHTFIGDGFKVVQQDGAHQVTPGVAIVGGLRIELKQPQVIYPGTTPIGVWVDVHRSGSLLSEHQNHFTIITSVADLTDHVDSNGYPHYVAKLGNIAIDGAVADNRVKVSSEYDFNYIFDFIKKLQSDSGAGLVGGLPLYVNADKYAGGASTSSVNNDAAINAAITDAIATGNYVYWPEVYEVQGNIPNFHSVRHDGPGGVKRGADTFRVHPLEWQTNTLYTTPTAPAGNDGLTAALPFSGIQSAFDAIQNNWAQPFCFGLWVLKLAAGTYTKATFSKPIANTNRFEILGPSVAYGIPTAIVSGVGSPDSSIGMYLQGLRNIKVQDIKFDGFPGTNGQGLTADGRCVLYAINIHASNCGWTGLNHTNQGQLRVEGGKYTNNRYGIRCYSQVEFTIGYRGDVVARPELSNNVFGFVAQNNSAGHLDFTDVNNNDTGVALINQSRCHLVTSTLSSNNLAISAESSSTYIKTDVTFTGNNRNEFTKAFSIPEDKIDMFTFNPVTDQFICGAGKSGASPVSSYKFVYELAAGESGMQLLSPGAQVDSFTFGRVGATTAGRLSYDHNADTMRFLTAGANRLYLSATSLLPLPDNTIKLGAASNNRFTEVCAVNSAINTSDAREKSEPRQISDKLLDAADDIAIVLYQWLHAIEAKGEKLARWHFGPIAQQMRDAFLRHGVDGTEYGLLCYDKWDDIYEPVMKMREEEVIVISNSGERRTEVVTYEYDTGEVRLAIPAGDRWGVRPTECHWLLHAAARRRDEHTKAELATITQRLDVLEGKV